MTDSNTNLVPYTPPRKSAPPVCTMRDGGIVVKIWENTSKGATYINATVERVYTDKQTGETEGSLNPHGEILLAARYQNAAKTSRPRKIRNGAEGQRS